MLEKIKNIKKAIKTMLVEDEDLRDDDKKLLPAVWRLEAGIDDNPGLTAKDFFDAYERGEVSHAEAIRRSRQKVQEKNEHLWGKHRKERMAKAEEMRLGINEV